ncbi:serine/threonine-protein kinase 17A-like [Myxocyprinus asiaticus]|uniref:serine/threonine-protein kinase 17A-like n=1 Tax=Myxocyprinus asiaticus TaxID=70543 RepID=UPI0022222D6D|nr:serine/threonine-protein kinase 17A-like [Myxocyprinus asiaticus]
MMNRNGMVTKIRTRIRTDPFKNNYELVGKELGRGKFAVVKKCVEKTTGKEHAAKFLRKRRKGQDCRGDILNEIAVLESAEMNPYVVALHEVYENTTEIILVLECAAGGEIFNQCVADNDEAFTEKDVIRLARQILTGVTCLHQNNVVHLDLKPQNILLTSAQPLGDIRIVDFGLSRRVDSVSELREILGTPEYVAPEILNYEPISTATDMWSIGVLTYVMLTGESPFLGDDKQETFLNISQVNVDYSQDVFQGVSDLAVDFIQSLLIKDPRKRATAEQCLNHPWLNSHSHHNSVDSPIDEQEASQSESEPESPVPSPELVVMPSFPTFPSKGELKTGRDAFSFSEPFPSCPEIQQELIC